MAGLPVNNAADNIRDDATIGFDAEGRVMSVSAPAASALGYASGEDLQGLALSALIGKEASSALLRALQAHAHDDEDFLDEDELAPSGPVSFLKRDGSRVSLQTVVTPETSGGWITLIESATDRARSSSDGLSVRDALKLIARAASLADSEDGLATQLARSLRESLGTETVIVARSTAAPGLYDPIAVDSESQRVNATEPFELPAPLIPLPGDGPLAIDSADRLALFEPAVISGEELSGGYMAGRVEVSSGSHLLVIALNAVERSWTDDALLTFEAAGALTSSALRSLSLGDRVASATRDAETVRRVGLIASKSSDDAFMASARQTLARRIPVVALAVHSIDPVTSRCHVTATSSSETSPLAPENEWQLGGSLEQHVLRAGAPVIVSSSSRDRVNVSPASVRRWREHGLQAVIAVPLRERGQVTATLTAGFASPVESPQDAIRLLEAIAPAIQIGAGISSGKLSAPKQTQKSEQDPGYIEPELLLALTRAASESPDSETLFASVTEWLLEIIPSSRVTWGAVRRGSRSYRRMFTYDAASAGMPGEEETVLSTEELESLKSSGIGLPEPGQPLENSQTVRCAVMADQRIVGVVTVWAQDGELFSTEDLARIERVCEFVAGPLARIIDIESIRDAQVSRDQVATVGSQIASFIDPAQAFRSSKVQLSRIFPNDRILFLEFDHIASVAHVVYDSSITPGQPTPRNGMLISALPAPAIASAQEPITASLDGSAGRQPGSLFAGIRSLLSAPVTDTDGTAAALLFLSEEPEKYTADLRDLAQALASHLTGAFATWQAHRSSKEWTNELRETRKQLNSILGSAPVTLINIDNNGVCTRLEGHGLDTLGVRREDMLGKSIFELTGKLPQLEDAIRQALRGIPSNASATLGSKAAEVWAQPVINNDGTIGGVTVVGYDVSERIRSRRARSEVRELQALNRERTRFIGAVSHELRNPLHSIVFYADILSAGGPENLKPQQAQALSVIQDSSERLDALINDLTDLSRLDTGDFGLDLATMDVSKFLHELVDAQKPMFEGAGQSLELDSADPCGSVQADKLRLTQVITNLLNNASKFSPKGTTVSVIAATQGSAVRITVADTGPGIAKDHLEHVFDAGYRVESEQTKSVPGTGLGLAIAKRITELHGGKITMESEPDKGTRVTITLPSVVITEEVVAEEPKRTSPQTKRRRPRGKAG